MSAQQRTKCAYYGRLQSAGRVVRDVCPHRSGSFYFTIDIDPGRSGGTTRLREAAIISPQNAVTNASAADDGPGYDLYIATDCIPVPEAPGIRQAHSSGTRHLPGEAGILPNEGWSTLKRIDLATSSFQRFYVAVRQKPSVSAGSSCSLELLPGHIVGGWSCSISDYTPNVTSTINWCEPVVAPPPAYLIVLTVLASCFVAALILFYTRYRSRRRAAQLMCVSADIQFRTSLSQKAAQQTSAIESNAIAVNEALLVREGSHAFVNGTLRKSDPAGSARPVNPPSSGLGTRGSGRQLDVQTGWQYSHRDDNLANSNSPPRSLRAAPLSGSDADLHSLRQTMTATDLAQPLTWPRSTTGSKRSSAAHSWDPREDRGPVPGQTDFGLDDAF